jgi:hypothetical protein
VAETEARSLDRGGVDDEAILHVTRHSAVIAALDIFGPNELNVAGDVVATTEVQHLLGLWEASDEGASHLGAGEDELGAAEVDVARRGTNNDELSVGAEELEVMSDVVLGTHSADNEVEGPLASSHLLCIGGVDVVMSLQLIQSILPLSHPT